MQQPHSSTLRIVRLPAADSGYNLCASAREVVLARAHPLLSGHVGLVDCQGVYCVAKLGEGDSRASVTAVYELQLCTGAGSAQPLHKEWCDFQLLPDGGLLLSQKSSARILFAQLPLCEGESGPVFLFGCHEGAVLSLATNRELLLSGGADGCVRLWGLDSGSLLDCCRRQGAVGGHVTAVAFAGPLLVAAGTDQGIVCMYDISTSRLVVVQRFTAGEGPITALSTRLTPRQVYDVATAAAPRGPDGGGVLVAPVGLPWRSSPGFGAGFDDGSGTDTLLAVASPAGWMKVFRAARSGEDAWQVVHHCTLDGPPYLSYSPDGNYLAVGAGERLEVLNATTFELVHRHLFQRGPLAGAGFLPASAGGSSLLAMQLGGSLAGGTRLRLFAAPAGMDPELVQLTLPLLDLGIEGHERRPETNKDERFPDSLPRAAINNPATSSRRATAASALATTSELLGGLSLGSTCPTAAVTNEPVDVRRSGATDGSGQQPAALSSPYPSSPSARRSLPWGLGGVDTGIGTELSGVNPAWGWQAFAPSPSASSESLGTGGQGGRAAAATSPGGGGAKGAERSPSPAEPWASPSWGGDGAAAAVAVATASSPRHPLGSWSRSPPKSPAVTTANTRTGTHGSVDMPEGTEANGAASAAAAHAWQAYRPTTQPAPRSWITGLPPRADFLPQPVSSPLSSSSPPRRQPAAPSRALQGSPVKAAAPGAGAGVMEVASPTTDCFGAAGAVPHPVSSGRPNWEGFGADRTRGREEGPDVEVEAGGLSGVLWHEPECELPCSATLLPATSGGAAVTAPPSSGPSHRGEGDSGAGPQGFSTGAAEVLEATFRFQQLQHQHDHHQQQQISTYQHQQQREWERQEQRVHDASETIVTEAAEEGSSSPSPRDSTHMANGPTATAAADWAAAGSGDPDPLSRTAFFGDALIAALNDLPHETRQDLTAAAAATDGTAPYRHGRQLSPPGAGVRPGLGRGRSDRGAQSADGALRVAGPLEGEGVPTGGREGGEEGAGGGGATAAGPGQKAVAIQLEEDDTDDMVPRGASGLPTPQPEWSQERLRRHQHLSSNWQKQQGPGRREALGQAKEVESAAAGPSRALAAPTTVEGDPCSPSCRPHPLPFMMINQEDVAAAAASDAGISAPESQAPAASQPAVSSFRGLKPNHSISRAMQQLRKAAPAQEGRATTVVSGVRHMPHQSRYDAGGAEEGAATPTSSVMPCSGSVLFGSPSDTATMTDAKSSQSTTTAAAVLEGAGSRRPHHRTSETDGRGGRGATTTAGRGSSGLQQLQHLRQLRHSQYRHQLLLRRGRQAGIGSLSAASAAEPTQDRLDVAAATSARRSARSGSDSARIGGGAEGKSYSNVNDFSAAMDSSMAFPWQVRTSPLRGLGDHPEADEGGDHSRSRDVRYAAAGSSLMDDAVEHGEAEEGPVGSSPLRVPQLGSTELILRKIKALSQELAAPMPAPLAPGARAVPRGAGRRREVGGGLQGCKEDGGEAKAVGGFVNEAAWEEAARRAATVAANVPLARQLYRGLPALDEDEDEKLQPARAVKHLHPGWVASRSVKPELETLWRPSEHAHEVCTTRGVATYLPPAPAEVAISGLGVPWLCL